MQEEVIYIELDGVNDIIIRKWKDMKKIMPLAFVIIVICGLLIFCVNNKQNEHNVEELNLEYVVNSAWENNQVYSIFSDKNPQFDGEVIYLLPEYRINSDEKKYEIVYDKNYSSYRWWMLTKEDLVTNLYSIYPDKKIVVDSTENKGLRFDMSKGRVLYEKIIENNCVPEFLISIGQQWMLCSNEEGELYACGIDVINGEGLQWLSEKEFLKKYWDYFSGIEPLPTR